MGARPPGGLGEHFGALFLNLDIGGRQGLGGAVDRQARPAVEGVVSGLRADLGRHLGAETAFHSPAQNGFAAASAGHEVSRAAGDIRGRIDVAVAGCAQPHELDAGVGSEAAGEAAAEFGVIGPLAKAEGLDFRFRGEDPVELRLLEDLVRQPAVEP